VQLKSRNVQIAYVFPRSRKLIAAEAKTFLETLAIWALMLALVLAVIVATIMLAAWWDEMQTTFVKASDFAFTADALLGHRMRSHSRTGPRLVMPM